MTTNTKLNSFPRELLNLSMDARRDYFLDKTINHPHLGNAMDELLEFARAYCLSHKDQI